MNQWFVYAISDLIQKSLIDLRSYSAGRWHRTFLAPLPLFLPLAAGRYDPIYVLGSLTNSCLADYAKIADLRMTNVSP